MFVDPIAIVRDILLDAGHDNVHPDPSDQTERISPEALSSEEYIWVEEDQGTTPHGLYADRPVVRVIVYSTDNVRLRAQQIQLDLVRAHGKKFPSGGIHRILTLIKPYRQDIAGPSPGVIRFSALYELVVSTQEKWD
jgi:hypothetical protein